MSNEPNQLIVKSKAGRPRKIRSAVQLQAYIDEYFEQTPPKKQTVTGLALYLGLDRKALMEYQGQSQFSNTIKVAKLKIENAYEERLIERGNAGDIFALKNFGWTDKTEIETTNRNLNVNVDIDPQTAQDFMQYLKQTTLDNPAPPNP